MSWKHQYRDVQAPLIMPLATGRYYGHQFVSYATATVTVGVRFLRATPFYGPNVGGITVTSLNIEITGASAGGGLARLGIYADKDGRPGAIILDAGTVAIDSTGAKTLSISQFLRQGWYWLAHGNSVSATYRAQTGNNEPCVIGHGEITSTDMNHEGVEAGTPDFATNGFPRDWPSDFETSSTVPLDSGQTVRILVGV